MSLEAVHTCTVSPLLSPTLKSPHFWEKKVIKPHLPSPIFLNGLLY